MGNPKPMLKLLLMLGTDITDTPDTTDMDIEDTTVWVDTTVDTTDTPTMPMDTVTSERDLLMPNLKLIPRPITDVTMVDITVIPTGATMDTDTAVDTTGDKLYIPLWSFRTNNTALSNTEILIFLKNLFF